MAAPIGNKNAAGHSHGRPKGSQTGVGLLREANTLRMQKALEYMLNFILTGELANQEGLENWEELIKLKMKLARGDIVVTKMINGQSVDFYKKPPDRESLDWLMHWVIGKQPDVVKFHNEADDPLFLADLTDEELKSRIAERIRSLIASFDSEKAELGNGEEERKSYDN